MIRSAVFLFVCFAQIAYADINPLTMQVSATIEKQEIKAPALEIINNETREKLKNPREAMRTFIQAMDKVKSGANSSFNDAISTLNLSQIDPNAKQATGKITAERLINTLDRIAKINLANIPSYENGPKWFFRKQTVTSGENVYDVEIAIAKTPEGVWRFSPETVTSIENFYSSVSHPF